MPDYGLDAELKQKQNAKYDHGLEREVVQWVESVTGRRQGPLTVAEWWNDGVVLCELANRIQPGSVARINTMKAPFKKMENISSFLDACRKFGVAESQMFSTPDLFEEKNMGVVINCLFVLGGTIQKTVPGYHGPKLGVGGQHGAQGGVGTSVTKSMPTQTGGNHGYTQAQRGGVANAREIVTKVPGLPGQQKSPQRSPSNVSNRSNVSDASNRSGTGNGNRGNSPRGPAPPPAVPSQTGGLAGCATPASSMTQDRPRVYQSGSGHHKAAAAAANLAKNRSPGSRSPSPAARGASPRGGGGGGGKKVATAPPPVPSQTGGCAGFVQMPTAAMTFNRDIVYDVKGPKTGGR